IGFALVSGEHVENFLAVTKKLGELNKAFGQPNKLAARPPGPSPTFRHFREVFVGRRVDYLSQTRKILFRIGLYKPDQLIDQVEVTQIPGRERIGELAKKVLYSFPHLHAAPFRHSLQEAFLNLLRNS